ncbi:MAG: hypothetical protein Q9216_005579 [Gyalolechia sp. 2 TL-2023]
MGLPKTFKQAVFKEVGASLTLEDAHMTPPGKGEILVKVEACGVCHSDTFPQHNILGGGFPIVPGHEIIGRVAAVGDDDSLWKVDDRVGGAWHGGHDGTCKACKHGMFQMCDNRTINGVIKGGGSHVDAAKYAPILCAGVTVFNSIRNMNIPPGSTVGVQGLGGLGHLAIQYCNKFGYRVVAISRDSQKEKFARQLGADEYVDASKGDTGEQLQKLGGATLIVATGDSVDAITPLLKGLGILGKLLILSGLAVQCWPSGHATDSEEAIAFTEIKNVDCMVEKFPLAKANDAFNAMLNGTVRFRAVITMD